MDSVNATNISRRKLGDCDFQDAAKRQVAAYEAHAGRLTDLYISAHLRTLEQVLAWRAQEWAENVGPDLEWKVCVVFVAHDLALVEPVDSAEFEGVKIKLEATTYENFLGGLDENDPAVLSAVSEYVLAPLALRRTPDPVRETLLDLIES